MGACPIERREDASQPATMIGFKQIEFFTIRQTSIRAIYDATSWFVALTSTGAEDLRRSIEVSQGASRD
jgi:hypothetical protein